MAKRKSTQPTAEEKQQAQLKRRSLLLKLMAGVILILVILYGYSNAYPLINAGQFWWGILIGVVYGGGALGLILGAFYLNRKMRGL